MTATILRFPVELSLERRVTNPLGDQDIIFVDETPDDRTAFGDEITRRLDAISPDYAPHDSLDPEHIKLGYPGAVIETRKADDVIIYASVPVGVKVTKDGQTKTAVYTKSLAIDASGKGVFLISPSPRDKTSTNSLESIALGFADVAPPDADAKNQFQLAGSQVFRIEGKEYYPLAEEVQVLRGTTTDRIFLKHLPNGGYGTLVVAYNPKEQRVEVIKRVLRRGDPRLDDLTIHALKNEHRMLKLFHDKPNIIDSYGMEEIDGELALVEPYIDLNSVQLIDEAKERFSQGDASALNTLFYQMASEITGMLTTLHEREVADHDIKLDNLLWVRDADNNPRVRKIDFGISLTYDESRASHLFRFTPLTVEPQLLVPWVDAMFLGASQERYARLDYETAADMYSAGVTLLDMMAYAIGESKSLVDGCGDVQRRYLNYEAKEARSIVHPQFIFAHHALLIETLGKIKEKNRSVEMFDDHTFALVKQLLAPRSERPESDELHVSQDVESGEFVCAVVLREETEQVNRGIKAISLSGDGSLNYRVAKALHDGIKHIRDLEGRGFIPGKVEYRSDTRDGQGVLFLDEMNRRSTKRFNQFDYLNPSFAEPEQYTTWTFPMLAPEDQREYWRNEQRLDLEGEAKLYELGRSIVVYLAEQLGVPIRQTKASAVEGQIEGLIDGLQRDGLDALIQGKIAGPTATIHAQHQQELMEVRTANAIKGLVDDGIFDTLHRLSTYRKFRPTLQKAAEIVSGLLDSYK